MEPHSEEPLCGECTDVVCVLPVEVEVICDVDLVHAVVAHCAIENQCTVPVSDLYSRCNYHLKSAKLPYRCCQLHH